MRSGTSAALSASIRPCSPLEYTRRARCATGWRRPPRAARSAARASSVPTGCAGGRTWLRRSRRRRDHAACDRSREAEVRRLRADDGFVVMAADEHVDVVDRHQWDVMARARARTVARSPSPRRRAASRAPPRSSAHGVLQLPAARRRRSRQRRPPPDLLLYRERGFEDSSTSDNRLLEVAEPWPDATTRTRCPRPTACRSSPRSAGGVEALPLTLRDRTHGRSLDGSTSDQVSTAARACACGSSRERRYARGAAPS